MTMTRSCTSTCVAARPTPSAAYMRLEHVVDELADARVDLGDRLGDGVQARIGVAEDVQLGHLYRIDSAPATGRHPVDAAQREEP